MKTLIDHLGSLRGTLALMGLLAAVVLAGAVQGTQHAALMVAVFVLLAGQLLLGLVLHPALRRLLPLLVFHLGLLALGVEVGLSRLLSLEGRFELTEGLAFDGQLIDGRQGAWRGDTLQRLAFRHQGFEIDYAPGRKRGATRNPVLWTDGAGREQRATIGDHRPLVIDGHRITTTPNKGFAPLVEWQPEHGAPVVGSVHLPSYPMHELSQSRAWTLPDGRAAWVMLDFDENLIDPAAAARFRRPQQHRLVLRVGEGSLERRLELAPGDAVAVPGGTLRYLGLRTWMGYRISHDPLLPWLLWTALATTAALGWHYVRKFKVPARVVQGQAMPQRWTAPGAADA